MNRKRTLLLVLALLLLFSLPGCGKKQEAEPAYPILFYYRSAEEGGDLVVSEQVDLLSEGVSVPEVLRRYLKGPQSETLLSPFPADTRAEVVSQADGCLTLRLFGEASDLHGIDRSLIHACLTLTLTQLPNISSVCIVSDENAVSAPEQTPLTPEDFVLRDGLASSPEQTAYLYFTNANGELEAERRSIAFSENEDVARKTMEALLAGPGEPGHFSALPEGTQLADVSVENGLCRVIFSEPFTDCDISPSRAAQAVRCVVSTLCSLNAVNSVQILIVDGSTLSNYDISQPLSPDGTWY